MTNKGISEELDGTSITAIADGLLNAQLMLEKAKKNIAKKQSGFSSFEEVDEENEIYSRKLLGTRIKVIRSLRGLTQEELGKRIGATQSLVTNYECGRREPGVRYLLRLARVLNVSVDWLVGAPPPKPE